MVEPRDKGDWNGKETTRWKVYNGMQGAVEEGAQEVRQGMPAQAMRRTLPDEALWT